MNKSYQLQYVRPWNLINLCPFYQSTPLREMSAPSGVQLLIKDETNRFGLGAFKALGGIYAVAMFLIDRWQTEHQAELDPNKLFDQELQSWSNQFTFVCASAGNHGMAVAKGAQLFNAKCRVHLADNVPFSFEEKLESLGAEVVRSGTVYEDSMQAARDESDFGDDTVVLLADSSWPGYTKMPTLVMEGYTVLAEEMRRHFDQHCQSNQDWPSHVFLQAGVGGLAAAVTLHIRQHWRVQPKIIVVEPDAAPCLYESNRLGKLATVKGPVSSMGRLDCKEPSLLAFAVLQQHADDFVCISESDAADAVSFLAEREITTTPSGAAGVAAVLVAERLDISIPAGSTCLAIATEGQF
ncbi:MAG: diaminopropionate ammonia-lyase [Pseudomonadales bacterium]|nr:diaminopropionate ammonia-lyase [Pseudomonadales bacterium]